ncbi:hypothetical protein HPC49_42710 [Pyxidicoccus fallax]|uniref:DUF1444 family protein n=1 Tax=Pyxidicoccus fallax TaxID=394095 RepID=A0A848LYZ0_9BACT|nr:hypothetical protein [Pyxidicoccus fallax]NMO22752.1 hypothetical protein [Pyxidicoccus fallax]NPC84917.1 hypothetical protein [Pyxidicoccus fallax]
MSRSDLETQFVEKARARGLLVREQREDGTWVVVVEGREFVVSLDNLRRNVERDADDGAIDGFIEGLLDTGRPLPEWEEARAGIRYSAEESQSVAGYPEVLAEPVTGKVSRVLVHASEDERSIRWLTRQELVRWGVGAPELHAAARENMSALQERTAIEVQEVAGAPLAMLKTDSVFKASLVLGPGFRAAMEAALGWPVLVVIPCRDFFYALRESDSGLLGRLGGVVVREYTGSGYPLTNEVLRVSDEGIRAIGEFPVPP